MYWIDGIEIINKATEKEVEQREWEMWISIYPSMNKENFISFDKFRNKAIEKNITKKAKTSEELIAEAENKRLVHQGKHKGIVKKGIVKN
jgi:hypothetical protein